MNIFIKFPIWFGAMWTQRKSKESLKSKLSFGRFVWRDIDRAERLIRELHRNSR